MNKKLILGSSSPRRVELIKKISDAFEVVKPGYDEILVPGTKPRDYVRFNSMKKGEWIHEHSTFAMDIVIVSADTIVVLDDEILQKPKSTDEATMMLRKLSGRGHVVLTSVCVTLSDKSQIEETVETIVFFRDLSDAEIAAYIHTGEPMDKAGSYGIQGIGSDFVCRIEGSMSNVIGLPVYQLNELLKEHI